MGAETGKKVYEALEVLFNFVEDGIAEAAFDEVLNELIHNSQIAARYDGGRADDVYLAASSFRRRYRKSNFDVPEIGFRGPAYDEPI